jgi:pimeloyl-ACP methyl ester carboxylesterase
MEAASEFVRLEDAQLHIRRIAGMDVSASPTIVFLHDALGSAAQWKGFPELVVSKTGMNALAYDRPGHGLSGPMVGPRNPDYLHREALEVLPSLLEKLHIDRPVLIGHSDGGTIALIHGAQYPVKAVITIAAHIFVEEITLAGIREAHKARALLTGKLRKYHGDKTDALFSAWQDTWLDPAFRNWSIEREIRAITAPVLAIQGSADNYGTMAQVDGIMDAVRGRKEKYIIDGAGHMPFKDMPEAIVDKIQKFLVSAK